MRESMSEEDNLALEVVRLRRVAVQAAAEKADAETFLAEKQSAQEAAESAYRAAKQKFDDAMEATP